MTKIYYETGRSNSGNIERFTTKKSAMKRAQSIADEFSEEVWVDARTEDDPVDYWKVQPTEKRPSN